MSEEIMTEENLIERMEHCVNSSECLKCPNFQPDDLCVDTMLRAAIDIIKDKNSKINDLENLVAINKGAMRAYREACENAHDEAVADFSHFLIDKAKDGSIYICDLPDLVAEWRIPERKDAELMKELNAFFDEAAEGMKPSPALRATSPEGRGKKFFLTCRNPEAEHWIFKRFTDSSRR